MVRRLVDAVVAAAALVVLSPILAAVAVAIRVTLGRPVLFRQERSGLHGYAFTIVKFRTMRAPHYPGEPDPNRTTRLGHVLRAFALDELPQLYNVLVGDMSLIGPRPTLPDQIVHYTPRQRRRLEVRPGLTGYAQVTGRNSLSWPERIELDVWYLDHRSLRLDLRIIARTMLALLAGEGITGEDGTNPGFPVPDAEQRPPP